MKEHTKDILICALVFEYFFVKVWRSDIKVVCAKYGIEKCLEEYRGFILSLFVFDVLIVGLSVVWFYNLPVFNP